jgi:hypothetical protein
MASTQLDPNWWKQNAPDSIATGEVQKALEELVKLKANLKKEKDPANYFKGLEKIAKTAVPKDEQAAKKKNDKDAPKVLAEIKKAAEEARKDATKQLLTGTGEVSSPGGNSGVPVPLPKEASEMEAAPGGGGTEVVDTIVNLAKAAWEIVKDNAPSASANTSYCQAMPSKAQLSWEDLSGWKTASDDWGFRWKTNFDDLLGLGPTIIIDFHLEYDWNGQSSKTAGLFLNNFTVWCKEFHAGWGWTVNVDATTQGNAKNIGSEDKPVGAIQLRVALKVTSKLQDFGKEWAITCGGDGSRRVS